MVFGRQIKQGDKSSWQGWILGVPGLIREEDGIKSINIDAAERHARRTAFSGEPVVADDPNAGTGQYKYRPCELMTISQVARKLRMPKARLQRKHWRKTLGAFQYGGP